jgi:hypothetical protein
MSFKRKELRVKSTIFRRQFQKIIEANFMMEIFLGSEGDSKVY